MSRKSLTARLACLVGGLALGGAATAQIIQTDGRMAEKAVSSFHCSVFADLSGDDVNQDRLFYLGYNSLLSFYEALERGEIAIESLGVDFPSNIELAVTGPSKDFMAGRLYAKFAGEAAQEVGERVGALAAIDGGDPSDAALRIVAARRLYRERNCAAID